MLTSRIEKKSEKNLRKQVYKYPKMEYNHLTNNNKMNKMNKMNKIDIKLT